MKIKIELNEDEVVNKSERELVIWIAEYVYRWVNPESIMDTPSIVYEQVEKDFKKFLTPKKITKGRGNK